MEMPNGPICPRSDGRLFHMMFCLFKRMIHSSICQVRRLGASIFIVLSSLVLHRAPASPPATSASVDAVTEGRPPASRRFRFTYEARVIDLPRGAGPLDIFIPIAQSGPRQTIDSLHVEGSVQGVMGREAVYGNRFWHAHLETIDSPSLWIRFRYEVERRAFSFRQRPEGAALPASAASVLRLFRRANNRVPVSGPLIDRIRRDLPPHDGSPLGRAKAVYAYVLDHMEYKKVGRGWGNGDTYWACLEGYGNCTDFHALFVSLARAEGLPTRFSIGFPIPQDKKRGRVMGYHCWADFYVPGQGWIPIDASEAWKHPERRDYYFGNLPADRVRLSIGRDLELGDGHRSDPLNYFVYPHVELNGLPYDAVRVAIEYEEEEGT